MSWTRSGRVAIHLQSRLGHSVPSPTPRNSSSALSSFQHHVSDQESLARRRPSCLENTRQHKHFSGLGGRCSSSVRQSLASKSPQCEVWVQARGFSHGRGYSTSVKDSKAKRFTYMDLWAGIGGFGLALTKLGGICVYANEIDPHCIETYEKNHCRGGPGISKVDGRDIKAVNFTISRPTRMLPIATIACAGIPCQNWSNNGNRKRLDDETNGDSIYEFVKVLIHLQNPIVILENVAPFATHKDREGIKVAEEELDAAGYYVSSHIYYAADFNLAQHRDRCFIVGIRKDLAAGPFEFKTPPGRRQDLSLADFVDLQDAIEDRGQYTLCNGVRVPKRIIKGKQAEIKWTSGKPFEGLKKIGRWTSEDETKPYESGNRIYHYTGFAACLSTREGDWYQVPGLDGTDIIIQLSISTRLGLQGFPKDFKFPVSPAQARKQIGNSVPPPMVEWITRCLQDQFPQIFASEIHSTTDVWPKVQARDQSLEDMKEIERQLKNLSQRKMRAKARRREQELLRELEEALEKSDSEGVKAKKAIGRGKPLATRTKSFEELDQRIKVLEKFMASLKAEHGF